MDKISEAPLSTFCCAHHISRERNGIHVQDLEKKKIVFSVFRSVRCSDHFVRRSKQRVIIVLTKCWAGIHASSFVFPPSFALSLKEQCHVLSDHLTQSLEDPSLLSDHLYLPLFFLCLLFCQQNTHKQMHTHVQTTLPRVASWEVGGSSSSTSSEKNKRQNLFQGQLAVSFSGNKVINKVMVPFLGKVALRCHGNSLWGRN